MAKAKKKVSISPSDRLYKVSIGVVNITEEGNFDGEATYDTTNVVAKTVPEAIGKVKLKDTLYCHFYISEVTQIAFIDKF